MNQRQRWKSIKTATAKAAPKKQEQRFFKRLVDPKKPDPRVGTYDVWYAPGGYTRGDTVTVMMGNTALCKAIIS